MPLSQFSVSDTKSLAQNLNKVTFSLSTQTCSLSTQTCSLSTHAVLVCPISHINPSWKTGLSCILHYSSWKTGLYCILYKLFMEDRSVLYPTLFLMEDQSVLYPIHTVHGRLVCPVAYTNPSWKTSLPYIYTNPSWKTSSCLSLVCQPDI